MYLHQAFINKFHLSSYSMLTAMLAEKQEVAAHGRNAGISEKVMHLVPIVWLQTLLRNVKLIRALNISTLASVWYRPRDVVKAVALIICGHTQNAGSVKIVLPLRM